MPAQTGALARWLPALLIALSAVVVYWNTLDCGYVNWDDRGYVAGNPFVTGDGGLTAIWLDVFNEKPTKQYYPLAWSSYWVEYRIFGDSPRAIHATQIALHALTAAVVYFVMLWLGAPLWAATTTGLLFAVHPINVASVAWIAERKNTLSGLFFFLSLLLYLQFVRRQGTWRYAGSLACYGLALFAKTACVVLAPILLVTHRVIEGHWSRRSVLRTLPFFIFGLILGLVTARFESIHRKSGEPIDPAMRPLVAVAAVVHYVQKTIIPIDLIPIYPRWAESFAEPRYAVSLALLVATGIVLWRFRRRISALAWWGMAMFLIALLPTLGFVQFNFLQFSFVSDHFMYLPSAGLFLIAGLAIHRLARVGTDKASTSRRNLAGIAVAALVMLLGWRTIEQNRVWTGPVEFWEYTLARNPDCFPGHFNLGNHFMREREYERALFHFEQTVRIDPSLIVVHRSCARCCKSLGRVEEAVEHYRRAAEVERRKSPKTVSTRVEYADYLRSLDRRDEALSIYESVLYARPDHEAARRAVEAMGPSGGNSSYSK